MSIVIRKPQRSYPIPENVLELDYPHPVENRNRYMRVNPFKDGYDKSAGDDPLVDKPPRGPSIILSEL